MRRVYFQMAVIVLALAGETPAVSGADVAQIAKGEKIYREKKCAVCHAIKGNGGKVGPDLSAVGAKRDPQWLKTFIKDPKATNPRSKMMSFRGDDAEMEALVAYLLSLQ